MSNKRYTELQVLCGLRQMWEEMMGESHHFEAETEIYSYLKTDEWWEEFDFADLFFCVERFFHFKCAQTEWLDLFGFNTEYSSEEECESEVAPRLTFGALAKFIAERAPVVATFEPLPLFGRECVAGGLFEGIQQVADNTLRRPVKFGPSTPIRDVLSNWEFDQLWTQLRWMTENVMPELPWFWRDIPVITACLGIFASVVTLIGAVLMSDFGMVVPVVLAAVFSFVMTSACHHFFNLVPPDMVTFRDLSHFLADSRNRTICNELNAS